MILLLEKILTTKIKTSCWGSLHFLSGSPVNGLPTELDGSRCKRPCTRDMAAVFRAANWWQRGGDNSKMEGSPGYLAVQIEDLGLRYIYVLIFFLQGICGNNLPCIQVVNMGGHQIQNRVQLKCHTRGDLRMISKLMWIFGGSRFHSHLYLGKIAYLKVQICWASDYFFILFGIRLTGKVCTLWLFIDS